MAKRKKITQHRSTMIKFRTFHHPQRPRRHHCHSPFLRKPTPRPSPVLGYFLSLGLHVLDISHNGIIQYMASCVWLLSLNEVSRLIRMLACTSTYFLFHCLGGDNGRIIKSSLIIFIIFPRRLIVAAGLEMCLTYFFFNRKCDVCYKMLTLIVIYCL